MSSYRYRYPSIAPSGRYVASGAGTVDVDGLDCGIGWAPVWPDDDGVIYNRGNAADHGGNASAAGTWRATRSGVLTRIDATAYQELSAHEGRWVGCTPGARLRLPDGQVLFGRYYAPCYYAGSLAVLFEAAPKTATQPALMELSLNGHPILAYRGNVTQPSLSRTHILWRQGFGKGWRTVLAKLDGTAPRDITVGRQEHWSILVETPGGDVVLSHDGDRCFIRWPGETTGWLVTTGESHEPRAVWTPAGLVVAWMAHGQRLVKTIALDETVRVDLTPVEAVPTFAPFAHETAIQWYFEDSTRESVTPGVAPGDWSIVVDRGVTARKPIVLGLEDAEVFDLLGEWAGRWAQVRGIQIAHEGTTGSFTEADREILRGKALTAKARMRALGLPPVPIYSYTAGHVVTDIPEVARVGVQLYPEPGETAAQSEHRWRGLLQFAGGRPLVLVCGAFDRRPRVGITEDQLIALVPVWHRLAAETRAEIQMFAYGRQGGAREFPRLLLHLEALARAVVRRPSRPAQPSLTLQKPKATVSPDQPGLMRPGWRMTIEDTNNPDLGYRVELEVRENGSLHATLRNRVDEDTTGVLRKVI
jgi:hypothetical protein